MRCTIVTGREKNMLCLQTCRGSEAVLHISICGRVMERFLEILKTLDILARMNRKLQTRLLDFGDWSVELEDRRKLPDVVAYKVPVIEFTDKGEATHTSRHAIDAAIMELSLSAHWPVLQHPNLVNFPGLAWGRNPFNSMQELPVIIVEFAECGSLSKLQQREYLGKETRRKLCLDVCQRLHMLHMWHCPWRRQGRECLGLSQ